MKFRRFKYLDRYPKIRAWRSWNQIENRFIMNIILIEEGNPICLEVVK